MNPKIKIALIAVGGLAVAGLIGYFSMSNGALLKGDLGDVTGGDTEQSDTPSSPASPDDTNSPGTPAPENGAPITSEPGPLQPEVEISNLAISQNPFDIKGGTAQATLSFALKNVTPDMEVSISVLHLDANGNPSLDSVWSQKNEKVKVVHSTLDHYSLEWNGTNTATNAALKAGKYYFVVKIFNNIGVVAQSDISFVITDSGKPAVQAQTPVPNKPQKSAPAAPAPRSAPAAVKIPVINKK